MSTTHTTKSTSDGRVLIVEQLGRKRHARPRPCRSGMGGLSQQQSSKRHNCHCTSHCEHASAECVFLRRCTHGDKATERSAAISFRCRTSQCLPVSLGVLFPRLGQRRRVSTTCKARIDSAALAPRDSHRLEKLRRRGFKVRMDYSPIRTNPDYLVFPGGVYLGRFSAATFADDLFPRTRRGRATARATGETISRGTTLSVDRESILGVQTYRRNDSEEPEQIVIGTNRAVYLLDQQGNEGTRLPGEARSPHVHDESLSARGPRPVCRALHPFHILWERFPRLTMEVVRDRILDRWSRTVRHDHPPGSALWIAGAALSTRGSVG